MVGYYYGDRRSCKSSDLCLLLLAWIPFCYSRVYISWNEVFFQDSSAEINDTSYESQGDFHLDLVFWCCVFPNENHLGFHMRQSPSFYIRAMIWGVVYFYTRDSFFRIMNKTSFLLKWTQLCPRLRFVLSLHLVRLWIWAMVNSKISKPMTGLMARNSSQCNLYSCQGR